jgi:hypothetical protein
MSRDTGGLVARQHGQVARATLGLNCMVTAKQARDFFSSFFPMEQRRASSNRYDTRRPSTAAGQA